MQGLVKLCNNYGRNSRNKINNTLPNKQRVKGRELIHQLIASTGVQRRETSELKVDWWQFPRPQEPMSPLDRLVATSHPFVSPSDGSRCLSSLSLSLSLSLSQFQFCQPVLPPVLLAIKEPYSASTTFTS